MKNYLKITIVLFCFSISNLCSAQIAFESKTLMLLQAIAFYSNYENIDTSLKTIQMERFSTEKNDNGTELITFKFTGNDVKIWVLYSKDQELIYAKFECSLIEGANNSTDLSNNEFKIVGKSVGNDYKKENYPYNFTLQVIDINSKYAAYIFNPKFGILDRYVDDENEG